VVVTAALMILLPLTLSIGDGAGYDPATAFVHDGD